LAHPLTAIFKPTVTLPWYKALWMMALLEGNEHLAIFFKVAAYLAVILAPTLALTMYLTTLIALTLFPLNLLTLKE
jgi:hypothetical protein